MMPGENPAPGDQSVKLPILFKADGLPARKRGFSWRAQRPSILHSFRKIDTLFLKPSGYTMLEASRRPIVVLDKFYFSYIEWDAWFAAGARSPGNGRR